MVKRFLAASIVVAVLSGCSGNDGVPQYQGVQKVDASAGGKDKKDEAKASASAKRDADMQAEMQKLGINGKVPTVPSRSGDGGH